MQVSIGIVACFAGEPRSERLLRRDSTVRSGSTTDICRRRGAESSPSCEQRGSPYCRPPIEPHVPTGRAFRGPELDLITELDVLTTSFEVLSTSVETLRTSYEALAAWHEAPQAQSNTSCSVRSAEQHWTRGEHTPEPRNGVLSATSSL